MEKDLTTLLAERDVLKHKAELERLRDENQRLLQQVSEKIDHAQLEITDKAISKSMEVLEKTRLWLQWGAGAFALLITIAGYIGYNSLDKQLTAYYTDTIHNWLRFGDDNSGGHKALDDLRTDAMLDSLAIRYARDRTHSGFARVTLNAAEEQRLMALLLNPATEDGKFRDALSLIVKGRSIFGRFYDDDAGRKLAAIVGNSDFSNIKRSEVLTALRHERAMFPLAKTIMEDTSGRNDEIILMDAFNNVREFDEQRARQFAEQHLNRFKNDNLRVGLAEYLIGIDADSGEIDQLVADLKRKKPQMMGLGYQPIVYARIKHALAAQPLDVSATARLIDSHITTGMQLKLQDFLQQRPYVQFSLDDYSMPMEQPQQLMGNPQLVDAIVKAQPLTLLRLHQMSAFFQLSDRGFWITTLMMKPAAETRLALADGRQVAGSEVLDTVWLRVENRAGHNELIARWRDKSGAVQEALLNGVQQAEQSRYRVDFSESQLISYTWHRDYSDPDLI